MLIVCLIVGQKKCHQLLCVDVVSSSELREEKARQRRKKNRPSVESGKRGSFRERVLHRVGFSSNW